MNYRMLDAFFPVYSRQITNWADFKSAYNSTVNWVNVHFTRFAVHVCVCKRLCVGAVLFNSTLDCQLYERNISSELYRLRKYMHTSQHTSTAARLYIHGLHRAHSSLTHTLAPATTKWTADFSVHFLKAIQKPMDHFRKLFSTEPIDFPFWNFSALEIQ